MAKVCLYRSYLLGGLQWLLCLSHAHRTVAFAFVLWERFGWRWLAPTAAGKKENIH